jgi:hypothetical protein
MAAESFAAVIHRDFAHAFLLGPIQLFSTVAFGREGA